jgi:hypothetical protein
MIELQAMAVEHIDLRGWNVENRVAISIDRVATGKLRNSGGIMRIRGGAALTWGLHYRRIDTDSRRG